MMRGLLILLFLLFLYSCNDTNKQEQKELVTLKVDSLLDVSYSYLRKDLDTSFILFRNADSIARKIAYKKGLARSLRGQAYYFHFSNQPTEALQRLQESEHLENLEKNARGLAATYNIQATVQKKIGLYDEAIGNYKKALSLKDTSITEKQRMRYKNNIANVYTRYEQYDSAIAYYQKTLAMPVTQQDTAILAIVYSNLGNLQSLLHNFEVAEVNYQKALNYCKSVKDNRQLSKIYNNLGALHYENGEDSLSLLYYKKSIKKKRQFEDSLSLAKSYFNLAELYLQNPKFSLEVEPYLKEAEFISKKLNDTENLARIYLSLAEQHFKKRRLNKAIALIGEAGHLIRYSSDKALKSKILKKNAEVLSEKEDYKTAFQKYKQYDLLRDSVLNADKLWQIAELEKKQQLTIKQKEISLLEKDQEVALANTAQEEARNDRLQAIVITTGIIGILLVFISIYFYKLRRASTKLAKQQEDLLQEQLENLVNNQELEIVNATLDGREKEKKAITKELHDNVGSLLTAIKFHLSAFDNTELVVDQTTQKLYHKVQQITDTVIDEIRNISHRLDQEATPAFNLKEAVIDFSEKVQNKDLQIKTAIHGLDAVRNSQTSVFVFRILQELVNNVIKHAEATLLTLYLTSNNDSISIMVEDNGKGFRDKEARQGIGLKNLRKQIMERKGHFNIDSRISRGTIANISIPI